MATANQVLDIARAELGIKENPANSNKVKYNTWYYGREVSGTAYPWCMVFVQWVFDQAGVSLPVTTASCRGLMDAAKKAGQWVTGGYQLGDVVIYDFPGGSFADHCGIVESLEGHGITAIEGNTSKAGSQSNGGMVCRKARPRSQIIGAFRPVYEKEKKMDNTPSPAHKEGVEWAREAGILLGNAEGDLMLHQALTREQFCTMTKRTVDWIMSRFERLN